MMTSFETLNPTGRRMPIGDILAFIPLVVLGSGQSLAFDGQQWVKVNMAAAFDPDCGIAGRRNEINLAAPGLLVRLFDPELKEIPPTRTSSRAVEMRTKLGCQRGLRCLSFPVSAISPTRQLMGNKVQQPI
jgi:hypothetical protein